MKTYHILIGNCEELLSDFFEALFREVCEGKAVLQCTRTRQVSEFVRQGCETEFDLVIQIPHNLFPGVTAPTPMDFIGEGIRAICTIKAEGQDV
jgi:hypothetical protein